MAASRILRIKEVMEKIGLSHSAIYARLDEKSRYFDAAFPRPIPLGDTARPPVGWLESEVDQWIERRVAAARAGG